MMSKQYVWLVRYGLVKQHNLDGIRHHDSELDPMEGLEHAKCLGGRLAQNDEKAPSTIYTSPYVRTCHTAQLIALGLPRQLQHHRATAAVRVEQGLTEWQTPTLVEQDGARYEPLDAYDLAVRFGTVDFDYTSVNPFVDGADSNDVFAAAPKFPETEFELQQRCAATLEQILAQHQDNTSICVVSHAPCNQALAQHLLSNGDSASLHDNADGGSWPLGGVTLFSRLVHPNGMTGPWQLELQNCTHHMPGKYQRGLRAYDSLPSLGRASASLSSLDDTSSDSGEQHGGGSSRSPRSPVSVVADGYNEKKTMSIDCSKTCPVPPFVMQQNEVLMPTEG